MRLLLAGHLGSTADGELPVRIAAHISYALHNQALAVLEGNTFDVSRAISALSAVDEMFGETLVQRFSQAMADEA